MKTALLAIGAFVVLPLLSDPIINSIVPDGLTASNNLQTLTVNGDQFRSGLSVQVARPDRAVTTHQGPEILSPRNGSFQVALRLDLAGKYALTVMNPDGGKSAPFPVQVDAARARTVRIDQTTPGEIAKNPDVQVITLAGSGFESGLKISITDPTGNVHTADTVDEVKPTSVALRFVFQFAGQYEIVVTNPAGESSNTVVLQVKG